jgi:hypothetical protein
VIRRFVIVQGRTGVFARAEPIVFNVITMGSARADTPVCPYTSIPRVRRSQ